MLIMDFQIWIVNNFASDPHGVVARAAPGELPMDHAQSCLTGKGEMMPALGMSHVAFCVRDMEKSLAFYQGALGFRVLNDRRQDTTTGGLPHVYKHRRDTRRQVTLAYGEGDARPQLVITEHPGEPPDGEPIKLDQIGISH